MINRNHSKLFKLWKVNENTIIDQLQRKQHIETNIDRVESEEFRKQISKLTEILKSVSSEHRILILLSVFNSIMFSQELEYILDASQPVVNHHLRKLSSAELIASKRSGKVNILTTTDLGDMLTKFLLNFTREFGT
ncbi:MAG: ArsR/SmtB family transcription factor [Candidatus Heimdallarchaeaceae archaeon]